MTFMEAMRNNGIPDSEEESSVSGSPAARKIRCEVTYALPDKQKLLVMQVPEGTTAIQAVQLSRISEGFSGVSIDTSELGIFSQSVSNDYVVQDGDRIEIYRPLLIDPKEARRLRAEKKALKRQQVGQKTSVVRD